MLPVLAWRVYCADGSTYTSDPQSIPSTVQAVVYFHAHPYRTVDYGNDFYEVDGVTLVGKEIPLDEFLAIKDRADNDMEWPT